MTRAASLALFLCACLADVARAQAEPAVRELPVSGGLGFETIRLPRNEHLGLVGGTLMFEWRPRWRFGPALYGAATGERGGFFVGGVEAQRRIRLGGRWHVDGAVFAGGGGGVAAPVGGGLMVRSALNVSRDFGALSAGIAVSDVTFPSGNISSRQVGAVFAWNGSYRHAAAAAARERAPHAGAVGLGLAEFNMIFGQYTLESDSGRRLGLIGARATWRAGASGVHWSAETVAAATGGAGGYMEALATVGWERAPLRAVPGFAVGGRLAGGMGGGGGVPTGGGLIGRASATVSVMSSNGWGVGAEAGWLAGADEPLRARTLHTWLALNQRARANAPRIAVQHEWSFAVQRMTSPERVDGSNEPVDQLGLKFARAFARYAYWSVQAHTAIVGNAGAYSVGLAGVGVATSARHRWGAGLEVLTGTGGGGGITSGGGALVEVLPWIGIPVARDTQVRVGAGSLQSLRGALRTALFELSLTHRFALSGL